MDQELQVTTPEVDAVTTQEQVTPEQSQQQQTFSDPYEDQAREQGWRPKEEYEGDPEKWRPAKEFVERGELFGKIDHMGKELKETRKALKMLQEHHSKVKETEYLVRDTRSPTLTRSGLPPRSLKAVGPI